MMKWMMVFAMVLLTACDGDCEEGTVDCDGDMLMECVDGELVESEDCAADDMICHDMGDDGEDHCMLEGAMDHR